MPRVLVIEDDEVFANRLAKNLGLDGFEAEVSSNAEDGLTRLTAGFYDAVLCDIKLPGMNGLDLLSRIREGGGETESDLPVLILTSVNSVDTAVDAMHRGASDYLTKEAGRREITVRLRRAINQRRIADENRRLRATIERVEEFGEMVGTSRQIERIKEEILEVGETSATVMLLGETGVGKELVARAIHRTSGREGEFVDVNGALLPDDILLQSELFGHEKGAFTDAKAMKKGKLELAHQGTLFIDEIGELSPEVQAKLLRVIETMTFTRVGGTKPITVDVRLIVATNRDLRKAVDQAEFRGDLYYRLNVFPIEVPPLRDRKEDIEPLARFFLGRGAQRYSRPSPELSPEALDLLRHYNWPGNIRELRNICERLVIRARGGDFVTDEDISRCGIGPVSSLARVVDIPEEGVNLDDLERNLVLEALRRSDWNQSEAARLLGISVDRMNNRVRKFGFTHPRWRVNK